MIDDIRALRDDLGDLSDWLHSRDIPPPLPPKKEQSVGVQPAAPRRMTPILLAPPSLEQIPGSPSSMSSGLSFLSSHHSDDYSLMESESYPLPASPLYDDSSSPSLTSYSTVPSISPGAYSSPVLPRSPVQAGSPVPSGVSEATVRPTADGLSLNDLRNLLDAIKNQADGLQHGQLATNNMLDELHHRPVTDHAELQEKLDNIENLLNRVLGQTQPPPERLRPETYYSLEPDFDDIESLRRRWDDLTRARHEQPPVAPIPSRPGPDLNDMIADLLAAGPQIPTRDVQQPPALTPLAHRPHIPRRAESPLPTYDLPPRPHTIQPVDFRDGRPRPVPRRSDPLVPGLRPDGHEQPPQVTTRLGDLGRSRPPLPRIIVSQQRFLCRLGVTFLQDGLYDEDASDRAPSAPPNLGGRGDRISQPWYLPRTSVWSLHIAGFLC
jgi:hypothetical protein